MATQEIIDLDALLPAPQRVRLKGRTYKLPADIPMPLLLRMQQIGQRMAGEDVEDVMAEELYAKLLDLFREHQPDLQDLPIGLTQMVLAINAIYQAEDPPTVPEATAPAPKKTATAKRPAGSRAGTRSTSSPQKKAA